MISNSAGLVIKLSYVYYIKLNYINKISENNKNHNHGKIERITVKRARKINKPNKKPGNQSLH